MKVREGQKYIDKNTGEIVKVTEIKKHKLGMVVDTVFCKVIGNPKFPYSVGKKLSFDKSMFKAYYKKASNNVRRV